MHSKIESAAQTATHAGAAVSVSSWGIMDLGWWDEHSAALIGIAAIGGLACSIIGLAVNVYFKAKHRRDQ